MPLASTSHKCQRPECEGDTKVTDARPSETGDMRRRRECLTCGHRHSTLEILYGPHDRCKEVAQWAAENNRAIFLEEPTDGKINPVL